MAKNTTLSFESLRVVGSLLGTQVLHDMRALKLSGQSLTDYQIERGLKLNDELGRYWRIAQTRWQDFKAQRVRTDINTHRLAQEELLLPLIRNVLGFTVVQSATITLGEREFPLTHTAHNGAIPLVLCGADQDLDKGDPLFGQEGRKRSPMGLVQEYLNAESGSLWGIVSNGLQLRLLRDNPAMTRPAYIEIDLERLFEEENYADFALFWLLAHQSRFAPQENNPEQCWLEQWRSQGQNDGERALEKLSAGVTRALRELGTGFVAHPDNQRLRDALSAGTLSTEDYFQQVLRLVYRFLFLLTAEDRNLALLPENYEGFDYKPARAVYLAGYSVTNLRERARLRRHHDKHADAWQQLVVAFAGFAQGQPLLAQPALGGLFAAHQCAELEVCELANHYLFKALFELCYFEHQGRLSRINYRDMDTEEFGSVYESLLELIPQLSTEGQWRFSFMGDAEDEVSASGHARKLSGSYYTPDSLVQELIKSALEPVITERLKANPQQPRDALLSITVCDPACGSGHFLLAAARRLAAELAKIDAGTDQPTEAHYRHALRDVVRHCIYGVDLNPMAVELCKTGLWLESIEPGKPLSFLDAHIQNGNALVGLLDEVLLENGIPGDAFKPLTGDDKAVCTELKKKNTQAARNMAISLRMAPMALNAVEALPEDTLEQVAAKEAAWQQARESQQTDQSLLAAHLFTAAFFALKTSETEDTVPTNVHLKLLAAAQPLPQSVVDNALALAREHRFLHWPQAFPTIFGGTRAEQGRAGFDVLLGNPPWERIKLQEQEFFGSRSPVIASAKNAAARTRLINALASSTSAADKRLHQDFLIAKQGAEGASAFARLSGRFPLAGRGDVNLYAIFAEHFAKAISVKGRAGVIVPTGIATDDSTKYFFGWLAEGNRLASLYDLENREKLFKAVDSRMKFCLLTIGSELPQARLVFFATQPHQLADERRAFSLSAADFALINPNTKTCPVFRSKMDAELTKKLYRAAPVLIREADEQTVEVNPWGIKFQAMFHMSTDSGVFKSHAEFTEQSESLLPLYEAKMVHHYDHRWATYETDGTTSRNCTLVEKQNPAYQSLPRYWVPENEVTLRTTRAPKPVIDAAKGGDLPTINAALNHWLAGHLLDNGHNPQDPLLESLLGSPATGQGDDLFARALSPQAQAALQHHQAYPLTTTEAQALSQCSDAQRHTQLWPLLAARRPKYLGHWRRNCRSNDERTLIACITPLFGIGDSLFTFYLSDNIESRRRAAFYGQMLSLVFDFVCRQKVGGVNFSFYYMNQLPYLAPDSYGESDLKFIVPRVLELTYTAEDLKPFAEDLGYTGEPFPFNPERRHQLKCELDAYYAKLYGLTREELCYILDPASVAGEDYPSETFRVLKKNEERDFGEYRTQRLVLEAWDRIISK